MLERSRAFHEKERAYLNIPFGFSADDCEVPNLNRKSLNQILIEYL
jgi:hypothetical protein